jgi:cupin fold WbuC family metalloprotein
MVIIVKKSQADEVLDKAKDSPRRRLTHNFHKSFDGKIQRMINGGYSDTYIRPHKHEDPDKLEIFSILRGKLAVIFFDDSGNIDEYVIIDENSDTKAVEVPPRIYHCFVVLSERAAIHEIKEGPYDPKEDKKMTANFPLNIEKISSLSGSSCLCGLM